jgi:large subunit ribosomal protein L31
MAAFAAARRTQPMQAHIHPRYDLTTITCASCGAEHRIRSTRGDIRVYVCAECHPFYTGVERTAARGGRIDRFERRRALATR